MYEAETAETGFRSLIERLPGVAYIQAERAPFTSFYISPRIEEILGFAPLGGRAWVEDGSRGGANFCVLLPYQPAES